jgi:hypothetical protein
VRCIRKINRGENGSGRNHTGLYGDGSNWPFVGTVAAAHRSRRDTILNLSTLTIKIEHNRDFWRQRDETTVGDGCCGRCARG